MIGGGGSGVKSEDVTARRSHVLQGYTALTADSDDEPVEGTIKIVDTGVNDYKAGLSPEFGIDVARQHLYIHLPHRSAYYTRSDNIPHAAMDANYLGNATADKVLRGTWATSRWGMNFEGTIPTVDTSANDYKGNHQSHAFGIDAGRQYFWVELPHRNAYYTRPDGKPHVTIPLSALGTADAGCILQGYSVTSQNGVNFQGTIPRWINTTGDVVTAWNNERHVWDDIYAGRGRGVISRVPYGHRIENANWVFAPEPNLQPHNIRAGVTMFGLAGTMPDYGAGRVAFGNATFDGVLLSEVAKHPTKNPLWIYLNYKKNDDLTVYLNGLQSTHDFTLPVRSFHVRNNDSLMSYGMSRHSINLTPFRSIRIQGRENHNSLRGGDTKSITASAIFLAVARTDVIEKNEKVENWLGPVKSQDGVKFTYSVQNASRWQRLSSREFDITLDVSDLQGHYALLIAYNMNDSEIYYVNSNDLYDSSYELHSIVFNN